MMSNRLKIIIGILLVIVVATTAINIYLDQWLTKELKEVLNKNPNRENNITFEDFEVSIFTGDISLHNLKITPIGPNSNQVPLATVDQFDIEGVSFYKLVSDKEIVTKTLLIRKPKVQLQTKAKQEVVGDSEQINALWSDVLTRVNVHNFEVKNGTLIISDEQSGREQLNMRELNLYVRDIMMDTSTMDDPFPFSYRDIRVTASDIKVDLKEYWINLSRLKTTGHQLHIDDLDIKPKANLNTPQSLSILSKSIDITHFDWGFADEKFYLQISKIEVQKAKLDILQNKKSKPSRKEKPLLPSTLRNLPIALHIDSVVIKDSDITYDQRNEATRQIGQLKFTNFYSTAYHITNDTLQLDKNNKATIDIETGFMDSGRIKAQFQFDLLHKSDQFRASGSIEPLDLAECNKVLEPLAGVKVSGQLQKFTFAISGNKWASAGSLNFQYDKLNVAVLNQEKARKNVLLSSLGKLVINNNNRKDKAGYKVGAISAKKEKNKSFFAYLWSSLKSGIVDIVAPRMADNKKAEKRKKK